eukprot:scaffold148909_cov55-Cyclotella_meneghiniana.AAC.2
MPPIHGPDTETASVSTGRYGVGGLFGVGGGTGTAAVDIGCDVMDFFAVFIGHGGIVRGAGVGSQYDAFGGDGGIVTRGLLRLEEGIAMEEIEGEAGGGGCFRGG